MDVAGLVLTVLPFYLKGLQEIHDGGRKFMGYQRALRRLVIQPEVETSKLENTLSNVLENIVTTEELQRLMNGEAWDGPTFNDKLKLRVGSPATNIIKRHVSELHSILLELCEALGAERGREATVLDTGTKKRLLKKLKFIFREGECVALLQRVYQINADLANLTMQQTRPTEVETAGRGQNRTLPETYNLVRQYTMNLHSVFWKRLQEAPACRCTVAHIINLRLQSIADK